MIYFVRHGRTDDNDREAKGEVFRTSDLGLNELGREQAEELAEKLKDVKLDAVVTSPLKRARETAEIINKYHGVSMEVEEGLAERMNKMSVGVVLWHELFDFDKNLQVEGCENLRDFFERVYAAIERIRTKYEDKDILVASSGGVNHAFRAYFNNLEWKGNVRVDEMRNCDVREYDFGKVVR